MSDETVVDARNTRLHMRFDKAFPVIVGSEIYGECQAVARNISTGGMMIEMIDPLPLGAFVTVHFQVPDCTGDIVVRAEVKHHYCFNFAQGAQPSSTRGIGLRFVEFVDDGADRLAESFTRSRVLH